MGAFECWFRERCAEQFAGPLTGTLVGGGKSNLTYDLTDGQRRWIVRRPPLGHVLATAHDMGREYRVMRALADTAVPVPRMVVFCDDPAVVGASFYVMEHIEGTALHSADQLRAFGPSVTTAIGRQMVQTLADLHAVDPAGVGVADFGRPEGVPGTPGSAVETSTRRIPQPRPSVGRSAGRNAGPARATHLEARDRSR
jgi:aminoglycoside phosphotransferase (APT) family kinase protein